MIIFRQKEFTSRGLRMAAKLTRTGRDAKFLGGYIAGTTARAGRTIGESILHPLRTVKGVGKGIVQDNKEAIDWARDTVKTVLSPKSGASAGKRVTTALTTALDFNPGTAAGLAIADKAKHIASKTGRDVARSVAELRYNPVKKIGEEAAIIRTTGGYSRMGGLARRHGGGTWTKGGVNNACLGTAPDRIVTHLGRTWEEAHPEVSGEIERFVNSREGRRIAKAYDRRVGKKLNHLSDRVSETMEGSENLLTRGWKKAKSVFTRKDGK